MVRWPLLSPKASSRPQVTTSSPTTAPVIAAWNGSHPMRVLMASAGPRAVPVVGGDDACPQLAVDRPRIGSSDSDGLGTRRSMFGGPGPAEPRLPRTGRENRPGPSRVDLSLAPAFATPR